MPQNLSNITVTLTADSAQYRREVTRAETSTRRFSRQSKAAAAQLSGLGAHLRTAANSAATLDRPLGHATGRLSAIGSRLGTLNPLTVGFGLALAGTTAAATSAVKAFADYERQMGRIEALVSATGAAAGLTASQINALAEDLGRSTLASAAGMRDAAGVLLTFRNIAGEAFTQTLTLAQDLAAVMRSDARTAALQLGKALEDPASGLTALRRSGVSFTEAERDMIRALYDAGRAAEGQALILAKLRQQVGGAGAAEGAGLAGAVDLLSEQWTTFRIELVKTLGLDAAATGFFNRLAEGLGQLTGAVSETDAEALTRLRGELTALRSALRDNGALLDNTAFLAQLGETEQAYLDTYRRVHQAQQRAQAQAAQGEATRVQMAREAAAARAAILEKASSDTLRQLNEQTLQLRQQAAAAAGAQAEAETLRHQQVLARMAQERTALEDDQRLTGELRTAFRERELAAEAVYQARRQALAQRASEQARNDSEAQAAAQAQARQQELEQETTRHQALIGLAQRYASAKGKLDNKRVAAGIAAARLLFDAEKRIKLKEALVDGYAAVQKAWASAPFPLNLPAVALTTATTVGNVAAIAGVAHGGLTQVPGESTWLLQRGERVLSPTQNKDFTDLVRKGGNLNAAPAAPVVNITLPQFFDMRGAEDWLHQNRALMVSLVRQGLAEEGVVL